MSAKRYITCPPQITISNFEDRTMQIEDGSDATCTFPQFVRGRLTESVFCNSMVGVQAASEILAAVRDKGEGDTIVLDEADWLLLKQAIETPVQPYAPVISVSLIGFMRVVVGAQIAKPVSEKGTPK